MHLESRAYTNDPLSDTDQKVLQGILADATNEIESLDTDISRLHETILNLEKRRTEGLTRIERLRVGLSPHKRIPPEILSKIFVHCDGPPLRLPPRYHKSIWTITQVCSRWRNIAMAEPLLWNQLKVRCTENEDALNALIHEIFSNRGGQGAISYEAPWITCASIWEDVLNLISRYPSRLLNLKVIFVGFIPPSFATPLSVFNNLESIGVSFRHLARRDIEKNPIMAFCSAQHLRRVTIHTSERDTKLLSTWPTRITLPWNQLTHLAVDVIPISICLAILNQCTQLVVCEVRLRDNRHPSETSQSPLRLEKLDSLIISDSSSYSAVETLLKHVVVPALRSLKFGEEDWVEWPQDVVLSLISRSMCTLETFETPARAIAEEDLIPLMRAMPQITEFNAFTKHLISPSTLSTIESENLAPKLCQLDGWRVTSLRSFIQLLRGHWMRKGRGIQNVRVWIPEELFVPDKDYFKSMLPELTKNGRRIKVLGYSKTWDHESD